jgi:hypothetical protein
MPSRMLKLVCFVYLVDLVHLVSVIQPNKRNRPNKPNNGLLTLADVFSILLVKNQVFLASTDTYK